jgi:hypothetical protein
MPAQLYNPKKALYAAFPKMAALSKSADTTMNNAEQELARRETAGVDTSYARASLYEAEWRIACTSDDVAAAAAVARMTVALNDPNPPNGLMQDNDGAFALGTDEFYLKLDRSTDQLLAREWPWRRPPAFLERINDPIALVTYLQDRTWSDVARCGRDNRKELNQAIAVIARLVMRGGQAGYVSGPGFVPAFERFVRDWQDPATGFFGMAYIIDDFEKVRTNDLSLTFHMVRYVPHLVRWWPQLIETLLSIRTLTYPQGWLEPSGMTDHNNYDVAELLYRGWPHMDLGQRRAATVAVGDMFDWCLRNSVQQDGILRDPDNGDPIPDSYYFAAAFLDTVGFFDASKKFWTANPLPSSDTIRAGMVARLKKFNPYYTGVDDALARLGAALHPWTNAVL